jgi:hypothetical protein
LKSYIIAAHLFVFGRPCCCFQRLEKLPNEKKAVVKELIEAFLLKTDLQQKLAI